LTEETIKPFQRVLKTDLEGNLPLSKALLKIHGIGFSTANAVCTILNIPKTKKAGVLTQQEVTSIEAFFAEKKAPAWMYNHRKTFDTGEDSHLLGPDLKLTQEFDIKRLKKIKSYRGMRHALGQPVRGQRTRSHFRHGRAVGVLKSKIAKAAAAAAPAKPGAKEAKK